MAREKGRHPDKQEPFEGEASENGNEIQAGVPSVKAAVEPPGFGLPGKPFGRSPFIIGLTGGLGLALAYVAYRTVASVWSILILVFVAAFLAVGLNPAVVKLRSWGLNRGLAIAVVGLGMVLIFCGGIASLIPPIIQQGNQIADKLPEFVSRLANSRFLNDLNERYDIASRLQSALQTIDAQSVFGGVAGGVGTVFSSLFNILMAVVLTFYFLVAFDRLKAGAYRLAPASRRERVQLLGDEILAKVGQYMIGALGIAACAGISSLIFMLILGIPYAYALALIVAIFDLIPQIGATLGAIIVTIIGFTVSVPVGIACVVFFVIYQQLENWFIYPKVMKRSVAVTDLAAIVAVLLGVGILGIVGALIAVPVVAAIQLIVREVVLPRLERS
ncbi:MAG: AI-2E family transporter [Longispora sp.]|nr:AI-2E family transporter [Longispora sp. (in: high G+C Gram-positive bacteria)]